VEHMPLSDTDRTILTQLRKDIETKNQKLKELRFFYQEQMQRFDEEMNRTFRDRAWGTAAEERTIDPALISSSL
ncbi:MAG: hypothetical protein VKK80_04420, partial [Prochlorothrix sp.]|nr:hypothetical protein [Prochlorothrix sp.]